MTLIAGVLCPDGLVFAADSEVTRGDLKTHGDKLRAFTSKGGTLVVGGAGESEYIGHAISRLRVAFRKLTAPNSGDVRGMLEQTLLTFHKEIVFPAWNLPEPEKPRVHLIVGFAGKNGDRALWATRDAAVSDADHFVFVGSGELVAEHVGQNLLHPNQFVAVAEHLVSQVVFEARLRGTGVGGTVAIWAFKTLTGTLPFFNSGRDGMGYLWGLDETVADAIWFALERNHASLSQKKKEISDLLEAIYQKAGDPIPQYNPRRIDFNASGHRTMAVRRP